MAGSFGLFNGAGDLIEPDKLMLVIGRPAFEQQDQRIELANGLDGRQMGDLHLADGTWALKFEVQAEGLAYRRDLRLFVRQGAGTIQ